MLIFIESQYYMSITGLKGGRLTTKDICAVCYDDNDMMKGNYITITGRYTGSKTPLLACNRCFDLNVELPTSGGISKKVGAKDNQIIKKQQTYKAVASDKRKARKN